MIQFHMVLGMISKSKTAIQTCKLNLQAPTPRNVKYTQTICRQQPTICLSMFDHFVELVLKELRMQ